MTERLILVGYVKGKRSGRWPTKDLYDSTLFSGRRSYAERRGDARYELSVLHGLVQPDQLIDSYDATLKAMSVSARREWGASVLKQLEVSGHQLNGAVVELHAGKEYRDFGVAEGLARRGASVEVPTAHMGIGQQLAWYKQHGRAL